MTSQTDDRFRKPPVGIHRLEYGILRRGGGGKPTIRFSSASRNLAWVAVQDGDGYFFFRFTYYRKSPHESHECSRHPSRSHQRERARELDNGYVSPSSITV